MEELARLEREVAIVSLQKATHDAFLAGVQLSEIHMIVGAAVGEIRQCYEDAGCVVFPLQ